MNLRAKFLLVAVGVIGLCTILYAAQGDQFSVDAWRITSSGNLLPATDSTYNIGASGTEVSNLYVDTFAIGTTTMSGTLTATDTTEATASNAAAVMISGGIGVAKDLYLDDDIRFSDGGTGVHEINLQDGVADALSITRAATDVIVVDSSTPKVTITPATDITGAVNMDDTTEATSLSAAALIVDGGVSVAKDLYLNDDIIMQDAGTGSYEINLLDGVADALSITRGSTDMILFDSSTPKITITPAVDITGAVGLASTLSVGGDITLENSETISNSTDGNIDLSSGDVVGLPVTTTIPSGNLTAAAGAMVIYNNGGAYSLYVNDDGSTSYSYVSLTSD